MKSQRLEHPAALVKSHPAQGGVAHAAAVGQNLLEVKAFGIGQGNDFAGAGIAQLVRVGAAGRPAAKGVVFEGGCHSRVGL
ncbi:hypothetical protein [Hymenobacter sp. BRD67]|uniref:hypothetical protein n=1 Tax=Hymenobacter sp. BRD67 TaxID=2675877 RepID=UPI001C2691CE|nr:hypothetical protein [Hymenobacter sp. BRD67]